jgi:hypothetical protein
MDRLWALKKEFDPFGRVIPAIGAFGILPIFRCTFFRCPYCRWIFKTTWEPSNSLLGPGERRCWHCSEIFWDGSQEWPEMNGDDRMRLVLPVSIAGLLGGLLVLAGLSAYLMFTNKERLDPGAFIFFAALFLPIACWIAFRIVQIVRSIRRYNSRRRVGLA